MSMPPTVTEGTDSLREVQAGRGSADTNPVSIEDLTPAAGWVVRTDVRHERLVWLAAKPELARIHRKWWHVFSRLLRVADGDGRFVKRTSAVEREDQNKSLQKASWIIDGLAQRFSLEEREVVRRTGLLPNWFWPAYVSEFDAG